MTTGLSGQDSAFARDLIYGAVARQNTIAWAVSLCSNRPFEQLDPWPAVVLAVAAYEILYDERTQVYAAVNEAVSLVRERKPSAAGFANAVLRSLERKKSELPWPAGAVDRLSLKYSHPAWIVRRWLSRFDPAGVERLLAANNERPPVAVRANVLKTSPEKLRQRLLSENGLPSSPSRWSPSGLVLSASPSLGECASFREGWFSLQDEASQLVVEALDPKPGEVVLDMCAAPGGKAAHAAERMGGQGRVIAVDVSDERLGPARESWRRLGLSMIAPETADARTVPDRHLNACDRVLVDAPCSALGILRRRPDARWSKTEKSVTERPALQSELLAAGALCVKPGGTLVYAVCSFEPEETIAVSDAFEASHSDFEPDPFSLEPDAAASARLTLRPDLHGTDGFFIARWRRRS